MLKLPCVKEIVDDFTKQTGDIKTVVTPEADHLFKIDQTAELLTEEMGKVFHNFTAKCLFLTKRARPDISTPVAFCITRVRKPDQDDWKKLQRMIRYLRGSLELPLILCADGTSIIKWWANGSHGVHYNMRGHTSGMASLGKGALMPTSDKLEQLDASLTQTIKSNELGQPACKHLLHIFRWISLLLIGNPLGYFLSFLVMGQSFDGAKLSLSKDTEQLV